jgi:hypothetical protein
MFLNQEKVMRMSEGIKGNSALPEVAIFQSFEELRALADQTLDCKEKMIYYWGGVENLVDVFDEEYEREFYIPTRLKRGIGLKLIIPDSQMLEDYQETDAHENRETLTLKPEMMMDSSFMIHDNTVVYFGEPDDHYAIEVKSPSLARALKIMFNNAWKNTE